MQGLHDDSHIMCLNSGLLVSLDLPEHRNPKPEGEEFIPKTLPPLSLWEKVLCVDDIHFDDVCTKSQITRLAEREVWREIEHVRDECNY